LDGKDQQSPRSPCRFRQSLGVFAVPAALSLALLAASATLAAPIGAVPAAAERVPGRCRTGPPAAPAINARNLATMVWAPFGRVETGWAIYAPAIARSIANDCPPASGGFGAALARWQAARRLPATGIFDLAEMQAMKAEWQARRPFVQASRTACPPPPPGPALAIATPAESYGGKTIRVEATALAAWRRLRGAAARDLPGLPPPDPLYDPRWLTIFSGFRDPAADAARCARDGNCNGIARARCSPHRTGRALDVYVGQAPGYGPDSSADANRLAMSRSAAYRWLIGNAARFGFHPYVFEPWHWEYAPSTPPPRRVMTRE
jgi:zinc D-Ala-D-Ala carboxypeptidase